MRIIVLLGMLLVQQSLAAGFECDKASSEVERLICSDRNIEDSDLRLNNIYKIALHNSPEKELLITNQRQWISGIRNKCKTIDCLASSYEKQIGILKDLAISGASDKEISFEEIYTNLNLRSFYSSFGPRLECMNKSYLSELFSRGSISNKEEWWYLDNENDFWSISITGKNNISIGNVIKSGSYRESSEVFVVYDNIQKEWRSIEASISVDENCVKKYNESPN